MNAAELRESLNTLELSQRDLAQLLDVTSRAVNQWATGERPVPGTVAAYLRVLEKSPRLIRDAERSLLKKEEPMWKEGMYSIYFTGKAGSGAGILVMENGHVYGADMGGGRYDGSYAYNKDAGLIETDIKVTIRKGGWAVQGVPPMPFEYAFNAKAAFPRMAESITVQAETDLGPVDVEIKYLRQVPDA